MLNNNLEQLEIEKFNPTVMEIQKVVDEGRSITISDFMNEMQVKAVRDQRIKLKEIRVNITKQGKAFRQKALNFQKAVIGREKELVALVEPEEVRLEGLENQVSAFEEREKRRELLPKRRDRLVSIGDIEVSDDELLDMDSTAFEGYCNKRFADKNEKDRVELEAKECAIKEAEAKAAREKEIKETEDRARADERKRAEEAEVKLKEERERAEKESKERIVREEREAKERIVREEREAKERAEKIERDAKEKVEREERERKEKAEAEVKAEAEQKKELAKDKKYQKFLASHGIKSSIRLRTFGELLEEDNFVERTIKDENGVIKHLLYKKVGEITL